MKNKLLGATRYALKFRSIDFRPFGLKAIPYLIILVVGLLLYLDAGIFSPGYWNWGDTVFPFFPGKALTENFYLWNMFGGTGSPLSYSGALPFYLLIFVLNHLSIPLEAISKIVYIIPTAMAGWFMYLLAGSFISGKHRTISCLVAALFYMLMIGPWVNPRFTLALAAMPLVLFLFIKGMSSKRHGLLFACLFAFGWLVLASTPHLLPLTIILILSYFIFYGISNKWHIGSQVKSFLIPAIIVSFSLSAFWILPQLYNLFAHNLASELYASPESALWVLNFTKPYTSLIWVARLKYGLLLGPGALYYTMPIAILAGFFIPIYAYAALLFRDKRREACYLAIMALFFTAFATGIHYPVFSSIYLWLWDHVPYFQAYRQPMYFTYPLALIYACLIGLTTYGILKFCEAKIVQLRLRKIATLITVLVILAVISINTFPYFQGTKYDVYGKSMVVPSDYYSLQDRLAENSEPGDRLLILPQQTWYTKYTWYRSCNLPDVATSFSPIPTLGADIYYPGGEPRGIVKLLADAINSQNRDHMPDIVDILGMLNIRYILIHNDILGSDTSQLQAFLNDPEYFIEAGSDTNFMLLELQPEYRIPSTYALAAGSTKPVPTEIKQNMQESGPWYLPSNSDDALSYSFTMVNPTRYVGEVNSTSPFILILNQEFNTNWVAHIDGEAVDSTSHFQANGYANAWYIDKPGSFDVVLEYRGQNYFYAGMGISALTFVGCLCYLGSGPLKNLFRKSKGESIS